MADNLREFVATLDRFKAKSAEAVSVIQRKLAFDATRRLVKRTPVGNPDLWASTPPEGYVGGHARRNWQVTVGAPAEGEVAGEDPTGVEASAAARPALAILPPYQQVWISNNVPYIERLEHGHSTQAPDGMLRLTFMEIVGKYSSTAEQTLRELNL